MPVEPVSFHHVTNDTIPVISEPTEIDLSVSPERPFNACLTCRYFRNGCSGPNVLLMTPERIGEFFRAVQSIYKISNAQISRDTGVSPSSVQRLLSGSEKDPRMSTLQTVARYLVGDPNGKHSCAAYITEAAHTRTAEALATARAELSDREAELSRLSAALEKEQKDHAADIEEHQKLQKQRYGYLKLKDRYIAITVALLSVSLIANLILAILL